MLNNKGQIVIFADKATSVSNVVVSACVSDETAKALNELCEKSGEKMSSLVRTLIEDAISLVTIVGE